jgi:hypothetical protein
VQLSITRRSGSRGWGPTSDGFERALAVQTGSSVIQPRINADTRRGLDHVRIMLAMTVATDDVADALAAAGKRSCTRHTAIYVAGTCQCRSQGATRAAPSAAHRPGERRPGLLRITVRW